MDGVQGSVCVCGMTMILRDGEVLTSFPPQYETVWWCGCGNRRAGPTIKSDEAAAISDWLLANHLYAIEQRLRTVERWQEDQDDYTK